MITINVNGTTYQLDLGPDHTLAEVLNKHLGLRGVRISCAEGECGSCTIMIDGVPMTCCLMLAKQAEGKEITTIEGIGSIDHLHPIQECFIEEQGYQCGFCTPGIILTTKVFLEANPNPTPTEIATALDGHICRCGAYPHIIRSVMNAAKRLSVP